MVNRNWAKFNNGQDSSRKWAFPTFFFWNTVAAPNRESGDAELFLGIKRRFSVNENNSNFCIVQEACVFSMNNMNSEEKNDATKVLKGER